jgi:hypothetical protein
MKIESVPGVAGQQTYDVTVDRGSLAQVELLGSGSGYEVALRGHRDANWLACYKQLRSDSPSFFRFCMEGERVLFACRAGDALTDAESILRILDTLVQRVNDLATASAPRDE